VRVGNCLGGGPIRADDLYIVFSTIGAAGVTARRFAGRALAEELGVADGLAATLSAPNDAAAELKVPH